MPRAPERPPPLISLGDALRAAHELGPFDAAAREAMLAMLGVRGPERIAAPPAIGVWKPSSSETVTQAPAAPITFEPAGVEPPPGLTPAPAPALATRRVRRTIVRPVREESRRPRVPPWLLAPGPHLEAAPADEPPAPPIEPLFGLRTERAILTAALSTLVAEGEVDVEGVVATLAEARPLEDLPCVAAHTLRRGADVLVDLAPGLDPFRADMDQLLVRFDTVLADDRLRITFFTGCPPRSLSGEEAEHELPWSGSRPGTPVIVLTDLGIGGPLVDRSRAPAVEWLEFAGRVRAAGRPLIAFLPYEARRWPPILARAMTLVHWSERTTAGEVRRAMREAPRYR